MINFDDDMTPEELNEQIWNEINEYKEMTRQRIRACEKQLEAFITDDIVDILVDTDGRFHYRVTKKGIQSLQKNFGECADLSVENDYFIDPWRLA
jgi:predicted transcriptional regulator